LIGTQDIKNHEERHGTFAVLFHFDDEWISGVKPGSLEPWFHPLIPLLSGEFFVAGMF
jgi:hypothetical protein